MAELLARIRDKIEHFDAGEFLEWRVQYPLNELVSRVAAPVLRRVAKHVHRNPRLYLVHDLYGRREDVTRMLDAVAEALGAEGIDVRARSTVGLCRSSIAAGDVVLSSNLPRPYLHVEDCTVFGNLRLLRAEGLALLDEFGIETNPWLQPADADELLCAFERWDCDRILHKRTNAYRAMGIRVISREDVPALSWETGDVFCKILTRDPRTYKVHFLGDRVLASYYLATPPVLDLPELHTFLGPFPYPVGSERDAYLAAGADKRVAVPDALAAKIGRLGAALLERGAGYCSIDFMEGDSGWLAVELNSNNVGVLRPWLTWHDEQRDRLVEAILRLPSVERCTRRNGR